MRHACGRSAGSNPSPAYVLRCTGMEEVTPFGASRSMGPLSTRERALLAGWERARQSRITRGELVAQFGAATASDVVKALLRKGVLQRIGRGVYLAIPLRSQGRPFAPSAATAAAALLANEPYYLGGLWAFSFHRLTEQQYGSRLDAFVTRRRRNRVVANAELVFHVLPPKEFEDGLQTVVADGANLQVSDPERTVLDALDYPSGMGTLRASLGLIAPALERIDIRRLIDMAARRSQTSTCQRLGVLLTRRNTPKAWLRPLEHRIPKDHPVTSMQPDAPRRGSTSGAWRIVENDE